jgi:hypothetical protein
MNPVSSSLESQTGYAHDLSPLPSALQLVGGRQQLGERPGDAAAPAAVEADELGAAAGVLVGPKGVAV